MLLRFLLKPTNEKRIFFFIFFDTLISISTVVLAYLLRFNFSIPIEFFDVMMVMIMILIPLKLSIFYLFKLYFIAWRYFGLTEYKRLIIGHIVVYLVFGFIFLLFPELFIHFPRSVIFIDFFLSLFFIGFLRISRRIYLESSSKSTYLPSLIFGVNEKSTDVIKSAIRGDIPYQPLALVSTQKSLIDTYFSNLKVYSDNNIAEVIREYEINSVIITEQLEQKELDELFTLLYDLGIKDIKITQMFQDDKPSFKDISIEDLLARNPKDLDMITIANFIAGKVVMITGAGGSIGSELSRQVANFGAKQIILLDHSEYNLYQISEELHDKNIISVMLSVKDRGSLDTVFNEYRPDVLIHAAAYKHVPLC